MRGVSNLIVGIALALVVLAAGIFAYHYLRGQLAGASTSQGEPGIACYAFRTNSSYLLFIVNILDKPVENVRVTYNASSIIQTINVTRIDPGAVVELTLPGRPIACISRQAVYVKVVNELQ